MNFSKNFKLLWWIFLLILIAIIGILRIDFVLSNEFSTLDLGLIAVFIALLLMPFYSEISLFGVSIKQKIEEGNKEIKHHINEKILSIRADIQNSISNINQATFQNYNYHLPSDEELRERREDIKLSTHAYLEGVSPLKETKDKNLEVDDDIVFAFKSRYLIESELTRLWYEVFPNPPGTHLSPLSIVGNLHRYGPITEDLALSIKDIVSIANAAIHGKPISEAQAEYLRDVTPNILATLKSLKPR